MTEYYIQYIPANKKWYRGKVSQIIKWYLKSERPSHLPLSSFQHILLSCQWCGKGGFGLWPRWNILRAVNDACSPKRSSTDTSLCRSHHKFLSQPWQSASSSIWIYFTVSLFPALCYIYREELWLGVFCVIVLLIPIPISFLTLFFNASLPLPSSYCMSLEKVLLTLNMCVAGWMLVYFDSLHCTVGFGFQYIFKKCLFFFKCGGPKSNHWTLSLSLVEQEKPVPSQVVYECK